MSIVAPSPTSETARPPELRGAALSGIPAAESRRTWARDVAQALTALTHDERSYLLLSYVDGLAHAHIADLCGVPVSRVSRTIAAGMQQLALTLEM